MLASSEVDFSLMFVTDDRIKNNILFFQILEASLKGGVTVVQLREKDIDISRFYNRAIHAKQLCNKYKVPLIINDNIEIASACDADGLHIGQNDTPYPIARKLFGENKIIGLSISNLEQAKAAEKMGVDYIGISPIFETNTKIKDLAKPLGIKGLQKIRKVYTGKIVCIGGINANNTKEIITNGSDGIAVVSAISTAENPELSTKQLKKILCKTGSKQ